MPRTTKGTAARATGKPAAAAKPAAASEPKDEAVEVATQQADPVKPTYRVRTALSPNMVVTVRNGYAGKLIYKSRKTGERFVWDNFGDEQDMELQELKNARNSSKTYFAKNWFLIDDPEVIDYLGVEQYYKNALTYENFDKLFELDADEVAARIAALPTGQRSTVAYRAKQLISEGKIDSIKVINALEAGLGVTLIER